MQQLKKRFWEVDFLRGIAVIMMIVFHTLFDLNYFGSYPINLWIGFWFFFGRTTGLIFIFLVGISLTLSYSRAAKQKKATFMKYLKRGLKIFCLGLLITAVTFLLLPRGTIFFGILHFIGIAIIISYPFIRYTYKNLALGFIFFMFGMVLLSETVDFPWLLWLGLQPENFYTLDYFPLFPWIGVVLLGIFAGNMLYKNYKRVFKISDLSQKFPIKHLCFIGRHSLIIYFLHQPILIGLLYMFVI